MPVKHSQMLQLQQLEATDTSASSMQLATFASTQPSNARMEASFNALDKYTGSSQRQDLFTALYKFNYCFGTS